MSSAKAALEADTRTLAYEAGRRHGVRINAISAGPWASRAASAIGFIDMMIEYCKTNSPLPRELDAKEVGATAAFLASPLAGAITGYGGVRGQRLSLDGDGGGRRRRKQGSGSEKHRNSLPRRRGTRGSTRTNVVISVVGLSTSGHTPSQHHFPR